MKSRPTNSLRDRDAATRVDGEPHPLSGHPYVLEDQVGHLLRRAHQRHAAIFQDGMGEARLTPTQFAALVKIGEMGEVSQNHLGRMTAMDPATIQGVIRRLRQRGLIEIGPDPKDRRRHLWHLTAPGRELLEQAIMHGRRVTEETLKPLSAAERSIFLNALKRLS